MSPRLCGFVALCESQVFVFQGLVFLSIQNLRKKTRLEQVVARIRRALCSDSWHSCHSWFKNLDSCLRGMTEEVRLPRCAAKAQHLVFLASIFGCGRRPRSARTCLICGRSPGLFRVVRVVRGQKAALTLFFVPLLVQILFSCANFRARMT